jgi:dTDP-4-dehydrorhamnose reductase
LKKKILIAGGSSFLASNWCHYNSDDYEIVLGLNKTKASFKNISSVYLDYNNEKVLMNQIVDLNPNFIVNAIGLTNVDECEKFTELSYTINSTIAQKIARISKSLGIQFTHISTDHLFKGDKKYVDELELISPKNIYGKSKANGEYKVIQENPHSLIIRTNFFGWGNNTKLSITDWIISNLINEFKINAFEDVFFTPILIEDLVICIYKLWETKSEGIYNVSGDERISKYNFALETAKTFSLNTNLIVNESIDNYKFLAKRPYDMSLNNKKLNQQIDYTPKSVSVSLQRLKYQLSENTYKNIINRFKKKNND